MEFLTHILTVLTGMLAKSHWVLFAIMMIESTSLPTIVPAEIILITAGYWVGKGDLNWLLAVSAATLGSLIGAFINYYFALLVGRKLVYKYGKYIFLHTEQIQKLEIIFTKYANILTFTGRLTPIIKHIISIPAGFCAMDKKAFTFYTASGTSILASAMITLGMFMGKSDKTIEQFKMPIYIGLCVFAGLIFVVYFVYNKYLDKAVILAKR
jgi:membrane protein DedA with SNARE-associated domain